MLYTEDKPFSAKFKLDYKILALIYICYKYKFPLSFLLSFYEMYGEASLFTFKAMSCAKKISLTDAAFIKILDQSKILNNQIIAGIGIKRKIQQLSSIVKNGGKIKEEIPEEPSIDLTKFNDDYREFLEKYLLENLVDVFSETLELLFSTSDAYSEITR